MDLGSARESQSRYQQEGDLERLDSLYRANGVARVPRGEELDKRLKTLRFMLTATLKGDDPKRILADWTRWREAAEAKALEVIDDIHAWSALQDEIEEVERTVKHAIKPGRQERG